MKTERIIFYDLFSYQMLGVDADVQSYSEFCLAFDSLATACSARGQSFEKV
jgi:hypothetical protein